MIPVSLEPYRSAIPMLQEVTEWMPLRKWKLSQVYRVRVASGETRIVKWGGSEMAAEAGVYLRLVHPLQLKSPRVYTVASQAGSGVIVMEDAGGRNLEEHPEAACFLEAARELARLRATATRNLANGLADAKDVATHTLSPDHLLTFLDDLLRAPLLAGNADLARLRALLPSQLEKLYRTVPPTIVHHDYHAKNLLAYQGGIMPIDWALAYVSPHLGDLYCLIDEALEWSKLTKAEVVSAYLGASELTCHELEWQLPVGGLCWLIKTLRWLAYGGTDTIPGSEAWIPDLLDDVGLLSRELAALA